MPSPRMQPLSQTEIVQAGLDLAASDGVDVLSFRRLASALDVSPMALYRHFDDKQALLAAMLDAFIAQANVLPLNSAELRWQDWLRYVAGHMFDALNQQPSWLPLLGQLPLQHSGLRVLDACLLKLLASGFSRQQAVQAFFGMIQVLFGAAISSQQLQHPQLRWDDNQGLDTLKASATELLMTAQAPHIHIGLSLLIKGLEAQLRDKSS